MSLSLSLSLIDLVVLLGIAAVLPLALGGPTWRWQVAASTVVLSFWAPEGQAAALVIPFGVVTLAALARSLLGPHKDSPTHLGGPVEVIAAMYSVVAAGALFQSRSGAELFGVYEPIVQLTSVHFMFAGTASLVLADAARRRAGAARCAGIGRAAVALTAVAPPLVALGFVTGEALTQVAGAIVMTCGVWLTAVLHLRSAIVGSAARVRLLLGLSGLAVWVPMILAVAWAAGEHWAVPALSITDMARTHGLANALGFCLCGLLADRIERPTSGPTAMPSSKPIRL